MGALSGSRSFFGNDGMFEKLISPKNTLLASGLTGGSNVALVTLVRLFLGETIETTKIGCPRFRRYCQPKNNKDLLVSPHLSVYAVFRYAVMKGTGPLSNAVERERDNSHQWQKCPFLKLLAEAWPNNQNCQRCN